MTPARPKGTAPASPAAARPKRKATAKATAEASVEAPSEAALVITLQHVVENVGGILEVARAPVGLDVAVGGLVIHDSRDQRPVDAGDVILGVGIDSTDREAVALVRRAGAGGAAAVVCKVAPGNLPPELADASTEAGVAVLGVAPDVEWGQLHALLRTARAAAGDPGEIGPGGTPVGDLFALANAVAAMVGGAATIEDPRSTVLAYSSTESPIDEPRRQTILGRRVPEDWVRRLHDDGVFRRLWAGGVVRVAYDDDTQLRTRLAVAVRAGGEVLGTIWVVEGDRVLDAEAEAALAEAGRIAALHLLRHRAGADLERRRRGDLLRSVLGGRTSPDALAPSLGVPASSFVTVVAFALDLDPEATIADQSVLADRAVSAITVHCEAYRRQAATVAEGHVVYVVLPDRDRPEPDRLVSFATAIVGHLAASLKVRARAGIGATGAGLAQLLASRHDADQVLRALALEPGTGDVAHIDGVRSVAVLLALRDLAEVHPGLRAGKLDVLLAHDRERQGSYVRTLRAYLDAFGDVAAAAASIHVHPNTFRYRMRRLLDVSQIDLDDPAERLVTHLQLTFLDDDPEREGAP